MSSQTFYEDGSPFSEKLDLSQISKGHKQQPELFRLFLEYRPRRMLATSAPSNTIASLNNETQELSPFVCIKGILDKTVVHKYYYEIAFECEQVLSNQRQKEAEMVKV